MAGDVVQAEPVDESHPEAADERPDAAVVIVVGQVQEVDRVVRAPVRIARLHDRVEVCHGPRAVDPDTPHEMERLARALEVEQIHQECQDVREQVAAPAEREGRHFRKQVLRIAERSLALREQVRAGARSPACGRPEDLEHALADALR
ncbi:MAG TPA: hypothetical protein VLW55_19895 [Burkholderiaceae bacterium]|nr:hypothetical protein [Burkholderiaceae bacterium]